MGLNLWLVGLVTTLSYLLAGVAKLVSDPEGWPSGKSLLAQIGNDGLYKESVSSNYEAALVKRLLLLSSVGPTSG